MRSKVSDRLRQISNSVDFCQICLPYSNSLFCIYNISHYWDLQLSLLATDEALESWIIIKRWISCWYNKWYIFNDVIQHNVGDHDTPGFLLFHCLRIDMTSKCSVVYFSFSLFLVYFYIDCLTTKAIEPSIHHYLARIIWRGEKMNFFQEEFFPRIFL